jgi:hypothetical protein
MENVASWPGPSERIDTPGAVCRSSATDRASPAKRDASMVVVCAAGARTDPSGRSATISTSGRSIWPVSSPRAGGTCGRAASGTIAKIATATAPLRLRNRTRHTVAQADGKAPLFLAKR